MKIVLPKSRYLSAASVATAVAVSFAPQLACGQATTSVTVSGGATAASNPYLQTGPDTAATGVNIDVSPSISIERGNASVKFQGSLELEKFFGIPGLDESLSFGASGEQRINERTSVSAGVDFRTSESAARRFSGAGDIADLQPGQFPDGPQIDPTLASALGRTSRLDVNASLTHSFDPKSTITATTGMGLTRVESASGSDYRDTSVSVTYSHLFAETTSGLITFDGGYADYLGQRLGDGYFITSLVGAEKQLTSWLHFSAQVGASTSSFRSIGGGQRTVTSLAGNLDLCAKEARGTACLTASRSTRPTSTDGLTTVNSIGVSYFGAAGLLGNVSFTGNYARSSRSLTSTASSLGSRSEFVTLSGTYRRKVGGRISAFVTPSFTSIKDEISGRRENLQIVIGLSHAFGTPE